MDQETTPFWQEDIKLKEYPPLDEDIACDVCVIGAGISGLTSAYLLGKSGKKVVVIDDGAIACGQSVRTTAHLSSALDDRYYDLEKYFGKKGAKIAAMSHQQAIDFIAQTVSKHRINCDFKKCNAYLFLSPKDSLEVLEKEFAATKRAGLDVTLVSKAPLKSFDSGPALCFKRQAHFHPLKYLNKLCGVIENQGTKIYCSTHVNTISVSKNYLLKTNTANRIKAKHVIVATNVPVNSRFFPHLKQAAYRTYAIAGKIPPGYVQDGLYYDTLDPYHYIRVAKNKSGDIFLIVGGEDHRTGEEEQIEKRFRHLESWAKKHFPLMKKPLYKWSGQVIEPVDSLAFIGRMQRGKEIYMITGDSGNGLTHGTLGALMIHDLILKGSHPWEKLYDPHRKTLKTTPEFVEENANTAWQYKDWVTKGGKKRVEKGSGEVVRKGLKKCAIYKDAKGKIFEMSAVCPHLGALVHWNESEHCWECPAHGSRFNACGEVIQGPANCNLKPLI